MIFIFGHFVPSLVFVFLKEFRYFVLTHSIVINNNTITITVCAAATLKIYAKKDSEVFEL
jgi:hypothetical protein